MLDILFIMLFFTFPILVLWYIKKINIDIFRVSIHSILIASIFVFAYIGVLPLYFGWDEYRVSLGITNKEIFFKVFLFNSITILGLLLGFHFSKKVLNLDPNKTIENITFIQKKDLIFLIGILIFSFIVFLIYLSKIDEIALFVRISEGYNKYDSNRFDIVRSSMGNSFPGKYHWYSLVMHNILMVVTLSFFVAFLKNKKREKKMSLLLFIISFSLSSFIAVMATEKAPFFWLLISLFLVYLLVKYKGKISFKYFILLIIFLFILLTALHYYMYWASDKGILDAIRTVFSRVFTGSIQPAYHYLEFFPSYHNFLYGESFPNPRGIFPFETFNLTVEIMNFAQPQHLTSEVIGTMPAIFWAEAYANFGIAGVFVVPFLVGILVSVVSFFISKFENTPIKVGLYVWLILHIKNLSTTGFSGYMMDFYLLFTMGLFLTYILIDKYIMQRIQ